MQSIKRKPVRRLTFIPMRRKQKMRRAVASLRRFLSQESIARRVTIVKEINQ